MSLNLAVAQRAQYFDNDGIPLSQGRVTFYEVGSSTLLKSIYADPDGVTSLDSQLLLDIGGFVPATGVFYEAGNYSIKVERRTNPEGVVPEYALAYFMPNVPGSSVSSTINTSRIVYVESVEAMANLEPNSYDYVYCFNYYTSNIDNGGGWFRWVPSSTATTDLGMVFSLSASANGRNFRMYDGNVKSSYYGVTPNRGVNMGSRIAQASIWAVAKSETICAKRSRWSATCWRTSLTSPTSTSTPRGYRPRHSPTPSGSASRCATQRACHCCSDPLVTNTACRWTATWCSTSAVCPTRTGQPELRKLSGRDQPVIDYLEAETDVNEMYTDIHGYLATWLPRFAANHRVYMTVAIGCTGGQHRSVYMAERLGAEFVKDNANVLVRHRELEI